MTISVIIEDTIFRNENNGYSVLSTVHNNENVIVVGCFPSFRKGEAIEFVGNYTEHAKYGEQFAAIDFTVNLPDSTQEILQFLSSGLIKGIGLSTAELIVESFGVNTLHILDTAPYRLREIKGIGDKRAAMIIESYNEIVGIRNILLKLQGYGFTPKESIKISNMYGMDTLHILERNPYILIDDIPGIGFATADKIALRMGFGVESDFRLQSGLLYFLRISAMNLGHTCFPRDMLIMETAKLLGIAEDLMEEQLNKVILQGKAKLIQDKEQLFVALPYYFNIEKGLALKLKDLMCFPVNAEVRLLANTNFPIVLNQEQRNAIETALNNSFSIITGGPGTGKTTILSCILALLNDKKIALCAPTGRAAKRMEQSTGKAAYTIHKLLEYGQDENLFNRNEDNLLEYDVIVVDEVSMLDVSLFYHLLKAIPLASKLILIGDADQLPSVGAGNVLSDLIESECFPITRLNEIYRQKEDSQIIVNAARIKQGELPLLNEDNSNFYFIAESNPKKMAHQVVELLLHRLPKYKDYTIKEDILKSIQVLSPMKKGPCGTIEINKLIQDRIIEDKSEELQFAGNSYFVGDKVIQIKNDYNIEYEEIASKTRHKGLFNGEIGIIQKIKDGVASIVFDESKLVQYSSANFENVSLAYCLTVHKSQGSEFPIMLLPLSSGPKMLLARNLLYTAITRASDTVVLIGDLGVLKFMVENNYVAKRYTLLRKHLEEYLLN